MIIAITAKGMELDSHVDGRFDQCRYFVFYDTDEEGIVDVADNPKLELPDGGGLEAGETIVGHDTQVLLTGEDIDPEAGDILGAGGVEALICTDGTVRSAVARYLAGDLEPRPATNRGFYPDSGSPATGHSREPSPNSDPGRETADTEVVGLEVECVCPACGTTVPQGSGGPSCEMMECPRCGSAMVRHEKVE